MGAQSCLGYCLIIITNDLTKLTVFIYVRRVVELMSYLGVLMKDVKQNSKPTDINDHKHIIRIFNLILKVNIQLRKKPSIGRQVKYFPYTYPFYHLTSKEYDNVRTGFLSYLGSSTRLADR